FPASVASLTSSGLTTASPFNNAGSWPSLQYQQQQPLFTSTVGQPTIQQSTPPVGGTLNNQV
ncbi:ADP-ribosylation factor GTPase-activating protein AGD14-like, partial [Trifolium medium]|nr:ADP-ribosylation factor GTPase-activating protein AGD14-like [Trifolium medium]